MYHYSLPNIFLYILGANQERGDQMVLVKRLGGKSLEAKQLGGGGEVLGQNVLDSGRSAILSVCLPACLFVCLSQTYVALVKSITCSEYQFL